MILHDIFEARVIRTELVWSKRGNDIEKKDEKKPESKQIKARKKLAPAKDSNGN